MEYRKATHFAQLKANGDSTRKMLNCFKNYILSRILDVAWAK